MNYKNKEMTTLILISREKKRVNKKITAAWLSSAEKKTASPPVRAMKLSLFYAVRTCII